MQKYISQLLADIAYATENISWPFVVHELDIWEWIPDDEEDRTAPVRDLEDWTGIRREQLPPPEILSDHQVTKLLLALKKLLDACNWSFVLQIKVPESIQYTTIRANFNQHAKLKRWHPGFFELCPPGTEHGHCALGTYCHCAFFAELLSGFSDEELSPEEERARALEIEIKQLKRKHGPGWMKYYPYYLDADYDDDPNHSADYGFGPDEDPDDWWKK